MGLCCRGKYLVFCKNHKEHKQILWESAEYRNVTVHDKFCTSVLLMMKGGDRDCEYIRF